MKVYFVECHQYTDHGKTWGRISGYNTNKDTVQEATDRHNQMVRLQHEMDQLKYNFDPPQQFREVFRVGVTEIPEGPDGWSSSFDLEYLDY